MRPRDVVGVVGLGACLLTSCTYLPPAIRPPIPDMALPAVRPAIPDMGKHIPAPRIEPPGIESVYITGPDRVRLFDGDPLMGELLWLTPHAIRMADGLTIPTDQVGWIEFGFPQEAPALPSNLVHDTIALRDGTELEGALIRMDADMLHLAVYAQEPASGYRTTVARSEVAAIALRDRRSTPCARAAVLLADGMAPGQPAAEVSSASLDMVHVFWLADPHEPQPDKILRCYPRSVGASGCQVMAWAASGTSCGAILEGYEVHAAADDVSHASEARRIYYAIRNGEETLGTTDAIVRGVRHRHRVKPARLTGEYRGEAHYWDRSWREQQDDGMHAVR